MEDSVFTKIINGEIPSYKVYEDELTIAIMDIHPVQSGMVLVISKKQVDHFMDLPDTDYQAMMTTVKKVALKMREVFPGQRVGVQIEGFDVPHVHVKLLPISNGGQLRTMPDHSVQADSEHLTEMAKKLAV